jgi:hypothetical protein
MERMNPLGGIDHSTTNGKPAYEQKEALVPASFVVTPRCFVIAHLTKKVPHHQSLVTYFSLLRPKDGAMPCFMGVWSRYRTLDSTLTLRKIQSPKHQRLRT